MDKRYQVFVSSTFLDLQEERQEVMQALLELDCIPSGMELFPAANEDQWSLIQKVIDDCDYYIVVLAGRYGSVGPNGLSYTEMEYRYATKIGKPVIGFIHRDPGSLIADRCERTETGREKLVAFRELVQQKMCRFWESPADLGSQVSRSLIKLIKSHPAIGWVRGDQVPSEGALEEMLTLRRRIEELEHEIQATRLTEPEGAAELAKGTDKFDVAYTFIASPTSWDHDGVEYEASLSVQWDDIFFALSPYMIDEAKDATLVQALTAMIKEYAVEELMEDKELEGLNLQSFKVSPDDYLTIKVQLRALGLITQSSKNRSVKDTGTYWTLTPYGDTVMTRLRAIQRTPVTVTDL
ncbi:DUF4062 domain-containing protein [Metapseudomonas otitidis]|uniref:DUF4062 domain-containing protein n=1 Tax=Metapseudomonas otitidis TaxID=319939 RepID=UPI001F3733D1|nr:DUF4062 domain-containing protein [Pseudomonas otitidis]